MKITNQRKSGAVLSYILLFVTTIISIIYTPFMTRMLGQSEYGLYSLISSVIGYLTILDFGFGNAIVIYTARYKEKEDNEALKKLHGMFFVIYCIIAVIALILGLVLFAFSDAMFANTMNSLELHKAKIMLLILTFNLTISFPFTIYSSIITANEKFIFQKVLAIIRTVLNPIIMLPLLLMGYKSITMVIVITLLNILTMICNYIYCRKNLNIKIKYCGIDKKLLKEIFGYSIFIFINIIIDKVNWSIDQFVLGSVSGTIEVSIYSVASQFNTMYLNFATAINGILLPKITKMVARKATNEELTDEFVKTGRIQYFILFLILTGFILFGRNVIVLLFGSEYKMSFYVALILMVPVTIPLTQNIGISILQAKNLHKFRSIILLIIAICNIGLSIPLAQMYGSVGTAIGTAISLVIGNIIIINLYYKFKAKLNIGEYWKNITLMTLKLLIPWLIIIFLMCNLTLGNILNLIIYIPLYVIIYCIYCYYIVMNKYEQNIVNKLLKKIHARR